MYFISRLQKLDAYLGGYPPDIEGQENQIPSHGKDHVYYISLHAFY